MSTKYTLNVSNHSTQTGTFCIFQEIADNNMSNGQTIAWLAKTAHPTTTLEFEWHTDYNFVWAKTTSMEPGTVIKAGQSWEANLTTTNQVTFDYSENSYTFSNQTQGPEAGKLFIDQTTKVRLNDASVGIGMSGKGTFLYPSQPNTTLVLTPKPTYWLIFGDYVEGEILDISKVMDNALKLTYEGTTEMNVELQADDTWRIL